MYIEKKMFKSTKMTVKTKFKKCIFKPSPESKVAQNILAVSYSKNPKLYTMFFFTFVVKDPVACIVLEDLNLAYK